MYLILLFPLLVISRLPYKCKGSQIRQNFPGDGTKAQRLSCFIAHLSHSIIYPCVKQVPKLAVLI